MNENYLVKPIGIIQTPFKEKFGIPRQSGLISDIKGSIIILPPYDVKEAFSGLLQFSHIWLTFIFHDNKEHWKSTVAPPRLKGDKVGIFASRSPHRPNRLGQSVVKLDSIDHDGKHILVTVSGIDLLDQTPIIDIKPYVNYADHVNADSGYAGDKPEETLCIEFSDACQQHIQKLSLEYPNLDNIITQLIATDPRPVYQRKHASTTHGMRLFHFDIQYTIRVDKCLVTSINTVTE